LLEEWSVQAAIEEEFKLPVSVMILNPSEAKAQAKSQVGFINLFTAPLFDAVASNLPGMYSFQPLPYLVLTSCSSLRIQLLQQQVLGGQKNMGGNNGAAR